MYIKYKNGPIHWNWYEQGSSYKRLVDSITSCLKSPGTVLDLGAGDGLPAYILTQMGYTVTGVDNSDRGKELMTRKFQENGLKPIEFYVQDIEDYWPKKTFDYLFCLNTIEHLNRPEKVVELMKCVKEGIIVTDDKHLNGGGHDHKREFDIQELQEMFGGEEIYIDHDYFIGIYVYNTETNY